MTRRGYIDWLRGVSVLIMIEAHTLDAWTRGAAEALRDTGPAVIWLKVEGRLGQKTPKPPRPMTEQVARLRGALKGR